MDLNYIQSGELFHGENDLGQEDVLNRPLKELVDNLADGTAPVSARNEIIKVDSGVDFEASVVDTNLVIYDTSIDKFRKYQYGTDPIQNAIIGFADVTNLLVVTSGMYSFFTGLVENTKYYASTNGGLTTIENNLYVGIAKNSTTLYIDIVNKIQDADNANNADNADALDGLDSTQFVRSDVADTVAGVLTFSAVPKFQGGIFSPDFEVSSDYMVTNLNANYLGGLSSSDFLRTVSISKSGTGYRKTSDGLIMQWNSVTLTGQDTNGNVVITLPTTFPTAAIHAQATIANNATTDGVLVPYIAIMNTSQVTIQFDNSTIDPSEDFGVYLFTIGY